MEVLEKMNQILPQIIYFTLGLIASSIFLYVLYIHENPITLKSLFLTYAFSIIWPLTLLIISVILIHKFFDEYGDKIILQKPTKKEKLEKDIKKLLK